MPKQIAIELSRAAIVSAMTDLSQHPEYARVCRVNDADSIETQGTGPDKEE